MNEFIKSQCRNMVSSIDIFEQACELAAKEDDGAISKEEEKTLKRIYKAAKLFKEELNRLS